MASGTLLGIGSGSTLANGGTFDVASGSQTTVNVIGTITLSALGTNVLNLTDADLTGFGVISQQGENDTTYVSSVTATDFQITGGILALANPSGFNGTIGPISAASGATAMGIFGQVEIFNAQDVAQGMFDTSTGMLSLLNNAGTDVGNIHFAGDASGLRLSQEPGIAGGRPFLAINDQGSAGNGSGGNIPLTFHA